MSQLEYRKAEEIYNKAIQLSPTNPVEALTLFSRAIFLTPEHWRWYYGRANTYLSIGDISSALLNSKKAHYLNRGEKKIREQLCLLYDMDGLRDFHNRHIDLALEKFNSCLRYQNPYPPALLHRGTIRMFFKKDQSYDGLRDLEQCRETCVPYVNVILGEYYLGKQDLRKASTELELSRKEHQYIPEVMAFKERFDKVILDKKQDLRKKVAKRNFETGLELANELINLCSDDMELYFLRAVILKAKKNYTEAIKDFLLCKNKNFERDTSKALLGKCMYSISEQYYKEERYIDCINYMDEGILWQNKDDKEIKESGKFLPEAETRRRRQDKLRNYVLRGDAYLQLQKYKHAIKDYRKAHSFEKNEVTNQRLSQLHLRWGKILMNNGKLELAEGELNKAIDFRKNDCEAYLFRAKTRFAMENMTEGVEDLVAYYLMNNRNESVNKLVFQYIPQIVYSTKIQRHYRKKFGLKIDFGENQKMLNPGVLFGNNNNNNSSREGVDISILGGRKSPPPPLDGTYSYISPERSKSAPTYSTNKKKRINEFSRRIAARNNNNNKGNDNNIVIEKPLLEFGGEDGIKFPEIYNSSMKREVERNLNQSSVEEKNKKKNRNYISSFPGGSGGGLSYRKLKGMTKRKKKQDSFHRRRMKRIRNVAIMKPSTLNSPITRIKDRNSRVWSISPTSSRRIEEDNRRIRKQQKQHIRKKKKFEEEEEEETEKDRKIIGNNQLNEWMRNQKELYYRPKQRIILKEIGKSRKRRKRSIDPLKMVI